MDDLIQALSIFKKYCLDEYSPTHCEHDIFMIDRNISFEMVSKEDQIKLKELGFFWSSEFDCWASFRFGSC